MAKPPLDADPELFIFGQGMYSDLRVAQSYENAEVYRIDPKPIPARGIVIYNLVLIAAMIAFHFALKHFNPESGLWVIYGGPVVVGIFTCCIMTGYIYHAFDKQRILGPWLIYNKKDGSVELPLEKVSFQRDEVVQLQYITTKQLDHGSVGSNERKSELNLITDRNGVRKRWPLLRSTFTKGAFDQILAPLLECGNIPIVRVIDQVNGWEVTQSLLQRTVGRG